MKEKVESKEELTKVRAKSIVAYFLVLEAGEQGSDVV